jgi:hypothetical protein
MKTVSKQFAQESPPSKSAVGKAPDIVSASVPDALATLKVNPETGLAPSEVDTRRKANRCNEVPEKKGTRFSLRKNSLICGALFPIGKRRIGREIANP